MRPAAIEGENDMTDKCNIAAPQDPALALGDCGRVWRSFVLPLTALAIIGGSAATGVVESSAEHSASCGPAITVQDPDLRASLIRFDQQQSTGARKICAVYRDQH